MTEKAMIEAETERELCGYGRRPALKGGRPCEREATAPCWDEVAQGPWVCAPHKRAFDLEREALAHLYALNAVQEWIKNGPIDPECETILRESTYVQREDLERRYLEALVKAKAAALIADRVSTSTEEAEKTAARMIRSDAVINTRTALEDLPAEALPDFDRFAACAVLMSMEGEE